MSTPHKQPKAMLLDLDDTIVTDNAVALRTWMLVCQRFSPIVGGISADALYASIRKVFDSYWIDDDSHRKGRLNLKETRRELVRSALRNLGCNNDELAIRISDMYTVEKELATTLIPGTVDTLRHFKEIGLRLALITNGASEAQRSKISRFGLASIFDVILIEGEFGVGKPHSSVFATAMMKLNVDASQTWMIGDDLERDIAGAQALGIYSIWVDWRGTGLPQASTVRPDLIVRSVTQLAKDRPR